MLRPDPGPDTTVFNQSPLAWRVLSIPLLVLGLLSPLTAGTALAQMPPITHGLPVALLSIGEHTTTTADILALVAVSLDPRFFPSHPSAGASGTRIPRTTFIWSFPPNSEYDNHAFNLTEAGALTFKNRPDFEKPTDRFVPVPPPPYQSFGTTSSRAGFDQCRDPAGVVLFTGNTCTPRSAGNSIYIVEMNIALRIDPSITATMYMEIGVRDIQIGGENDADAILAPIDNLVLVPENISLQTNVLGAHFSNPTFVFGSGTIRLPYPIGPDGTEFNWSFIPGFDEFLFTLTPSGDLRFRAQPDFESPGYFDTTPHYELVFNVALKDGSLSKRIDYFVRLVDVEPEVELTGLTLPTGLFRDRALPEDTSTDVDLLAIFNGLPRLEPDGTTTIFYPAHPNGPEALEYRFPENSDYDNEFFRLEPDGRMFLRAPLDFENPVDKAVPPPPAPFIAADLAAGDNFYIVEIDIIVKNSDPEERGTIYYGFVIADVLDDDSGAAMLEPPSQAWRTRHQENIATSTNLLAEIFARSNTLRTRYYPAHPDGLGALTYQFPATSNTDNHLFTITSDGDLRFRSSPDYENPTDGLVPTPPASDNPIERISDAQPAQNNDYIVEIDVTADRSTLDDEGMIIRTIEEEITIYYSIAIEDVGPAPPTEGHFVPVNENYPTTSNILAPIFARVNQPGRADPLGGPDHLAERYYPTHPGGNAQLEWRLTQNSAYDNTFFTITPSGDLRFVNSPNYESPQDASTTVPPAPYDSLMRLKDGTMGAGMMAGDNLYVVEIEVTSRTDPGELVVIYYGVRVQDVVDEAPVATAILPPTQGYYFRYAENLPAFDILGTLFSNYPNTGVERFAPVHTDGNTQLNWSFPATSAYDNAFFTITPGGALRFVNPPDYENPQDTSTAIPPPPYNRLRNPGDSVVYDNLLSGYARDNIYIVELQVDSGQGNMITVYYAIEVMAVHEGGPIWDDRDYHTSAAVNGAIVDADPNPRNLRTLVLENERYNPDTRPFRNAPITVKSRYVTDPDGDPITVRHCGPADNFCGQGIRRTDGYLPDGVTPRFIFRDNATPGLPDRDTRDLYADFYFDPGTPANRYPYSPNFEQPADHAYLHDRPEYAAQNNRYNILFEASSMGTNGIDKALFYILVDIVNVNELPVITADSAAGTDRANPILVPEGTTIIDNIPALTASDPDAAEAGLATEWIKDRAPYGHPDDAGVDQADFEDAIVVTLATGAVRFLNPVDYEAPFAPDRYLWQIARRARIGDGPRARAGPNYNIWIQITPVDEFSPTFSAKPDSVEVAVGETEVETFTLNDEDEGETRSFALTGDDAGLFEISSPTDATASAVSGTLSFRQPARPGTYRVTVTGTSTSDTCEATPTPPVPCQESFDLTVEVPDAVPVFSVRADSYNFTQPEGSTETFTLVATEADGDDVMFTLLNVPGEEADADAIYLNLVDAGDGDDTATLGFAAPTDFGNPRGMPASNDNTNTYRVRVQASSTATDVGATPNDPKRVIQTITIAVTEVIRPVLETTETAYDVAENTTATGVALVGNDSRHPSPEMVRFTKAGADAARFDLGATTGVLTFVSAPDFEMPRSAPLSSTNTNIYRLSVRAEVGTGGDVRRSAPLDLEITVTDADESPAFRDDVAYNYTFDDDDAGGTVSLVASDIAPDPDGDTVVLRLAAASGSNDNHALMLNASGTTLSFRDTPDFENPIDQNIPSGSAAGDNTYVMHLIAASTGTSGAEKTATLTSATVMVLDRTGDLPVLDAIGADHEVAENTNPPPPILTLNATEYNDLPLRFAIIAGAVASPDAAHFTLDDVSGALTFASPPDFEMPRGSAPGPANTNIYRLSVRARSQLPGGGFIDGAALSLRITVTPVDEDPTLTITDGPYNLAENSTAVIVTLTAADPDEGDVVRFIKTGTDEALFSLDATGALSFADGPDFENPRGMPLAPTNTNTYNLSVQATSTSGSTGASERRSATLDLVITVTSVDEFAPVLAPKTSPLTTTEGETAALQTFTLSDADAGEAQSFALTGTDASSFTLDTTTGVLRLPTTTDAGNYDLTVTGTSGGRADSFALIVNVMADNPAVFAGTEFELLENSDPPQVMLSATDADDATVTLTLMNVQDGALFTLEDISSTGGTTTANLRFIAQPDFEAPADTATPAGDNIYLVQLRASSMSLRGEVPITETIRVEVTPVDEDPPVLAPKTSPLASVEGELAVQTFTLTDADAGEAQTFTLSGADSDLFDINANGELTIDPGTIAGSYSLTVTGTSGSREDVFDLIVNIAIDADPMISMPSFSLAENTNNPITLTATEENNDDVMFALQPGLDADRFNFTDGGAADNTATLTFKAAPDFENPQDAGGNNVYELSVQASSMTATRAVRTIMETIRITVTGVDEHDPTLTITDAPYESAENSTPVIATLTGADQDRGDVVRLIKTGTDEALFDLNAAGELSFAAAPDFENPRRSPLAADNTNTYELSVQAESTSTSGSGSGSGTTKTSDALALTIRVTPEDESAPRIIATPDTYNFLTDTTGAIATFTLEDADAGAADAGAGAGGEARQFEVLGGTGAGSGLFSLTPSGTGTASETANLTFTGAAPTGTSELTITATSGGRMATLPITVVVSEDQTPSFQVTSFPVDENSTPNFELSAPDPDGSDIDVTLSLVAGLDGALFALSNIVPGSASATLRFINAPDFEAPQDVATTTPSDPAGDNVYLVNIQASSPDLAGDTVDITQTIRVTVANLDDNPPTLTTTETDHPVAEEGTDTFLTLVGSDPDGNTVRFITAGGADEALFSLNRDTGALSFTSAPDFERPRGMPLAAGNTNTYRLSVQAESGTDPNEQRSAALDLVITVTPVDESEPVLAPQDSPISVFTDATVVQTFTLTDADAGENQSFSLGGTGAGFFALDAMTGVLTLAATTAGSYSLTVTGTSGSDADSFTLTVDVIADAAPVFVATSFDVPENETPTRTLRATEANDDDVVFSLQSGLDAGRFTFADGGLGANTATLTFNAAPDFETPLAVSGDNIYQVSVQASSMTGTRAALTTTETISITVTDADEDPRLTISSGPHDLVENSTAVIVTLTGADPDDGDVVRFTKAGGADAALFDLDMATGALSFAAAPDFENPRGAPLSGGNTNTYNLSVQATSTSGSGAGLDTKTSDPLALTIRVTGEDEDAPVLAPKTSPLATVVGEMAPLQTFTITDADAGEAQSFALSGTDTNSFELNTTTGVLELAATTGAGSYSLTVTGTSGSREDSFALTVDVAADAAPAFVETNFSVAENTNNPITLEATEANGDDVVFSLLNESDAGRFTFADGGAGANTATLTFNAVPDFETPLAASGGNIYQVRVQASSMTGPRAARTTAGIINITVTDVDEDPRLTISPDPGVDGTTFTRQYSLAENSTNVMATLTGADPDDGDVVRLIIAGDDAARFSLNATTGALSFVSAPDFERPRGALLADDNTNDYNLSVQAESGTGPNTKTSETLALTIRVTPEDESAPRITASPGRSTHNFLTGATGAIATFTLEDTDAGATDAGAGTGGEARQFGVLGGTGAASGLFSLAPTGAASETANLTFASAATTGTRALTITATSGGQTATLSITVVVSDDQTPSLQTASFDVAENSAPDLQLSAPDPDGGDIDVTLSLLPGLDGALFALNNIVPSSASATLRFINAPNYENPIDAAITTPLDPAGDNVYLVNIQASSMNLVGTLVNITQIIRVTVTDVDEVPTLITTRTDHTVMENSSEVLTLQGRDPDDGDVVRFVTAGGADEARFNLDSGTGILTFASPPDFENPRGIPLSGANTNDYSLSVQVEGAAATEAPLGLNIRVLNINAIPVFDTPGDSFAPQIFGGLTAVGTYTATVPSGAITYSLDPSEDHALFRYGATDGALAFAAPATLPASGNAYNLTLIATSDGDNNHNSVTQAISVQVMADRAPVITGGAATYEWVENSTGVIATFTASDPDIGSTAATFSLGGDDADDFSINGVTGTLRFSAAAGPNHEVPTDAGADNVYQVTVIASSVSPPVMTPVMAMQAVTITVTGVDEFPPQIEPASTSVAIVLTGATHVRTYTITDEDRDETIQFPTSITGTTVALFEFDQNTNTVRFRAPAQAGNYALMVVGMIGTREVTQALTVQVLDDAGPVFAAVGRNSAIETSENIAEDLFVSASDANGDDVTFEVLDTPDLQYFDFVDGGASLDTATFYFKNAPDYENPRGAPLAINNNNSYQLAILASSQSAGNAPLQARRFLTIEVTAEDEADPEITATETALSINEGTSGTLLTYAATDADAGEGDFAWSIGGADETHFSINDAGELQFDPAPDYENPRGVPLASDNTNTYNIEVIVTRGSKTDTADLVVTVTDVIATPTFAGPPATSINVIAGTRAVATYTATAPSGAITYSLAGASEAVLEVSDTGVLSFTDDASAASSPYIVTLTATSDSDDNGNTAELELTITVIPDNPPAFTTAADTFLPNENTTAVGTIVVADPDTTPFTSTTATLRVVEDSADGVDWALFNLTGTALSFVEAPNFEQPEDADGNDIYVIEIEASTTTGSASALTTRLVLNVRVVNVEEAPQFVAPPSDSSVTLETEVEVAEENPFVALYAIEEDRVDTLASITISVNPVDSAGDPVFTVSRVDSPTPVRAVSPTIEAARFIYAQVRFAKAPAFNASDPSANEYSVTLQTRSASGRTAELPLTVTVIEDAAPVVTMTSFTLAENTDTLPLVATEADGDDVSFDGLGGADQDLFTLADDGASASTATLTFNSAPDFENAGDADGDNVYRVSVQASSITDSKEPQRVTATLTITVTDADDPPTFTTAADALMIIEGETALTAMLEVIDQDGDSVALTLTGGADQARLRLTGTALSFAAAPDFEAPADADADNIYEVEITASSTATGGTELSAVRTFNIAVTDVDDNAPELTSATTYQVQSGETAVATLEATDADAGDTETIEFSLSGGADQSQFTLTLAGVLSFASASDFNEPTDADGDNFYAIEITLTSGSRQLTTEAALEIEVINIDRESRQRIGNVILAHIARSLADNTQDVILARTSGRLTNNLELSNRQGNLDDLIKGIQGFSFMQRLDSKQADARQAAVAATLQGKRSGHLSVWAKGHIRTFSASPNETAINNFSGNTYNLNLGADYQTGGVLFGGLVTASQSSVKFTSGSVEGQGKIATKLTTFAPYVHLRLKGGTEFWGSASFGQGRMRYQSETTTDGGFERTDLKYSQFAGGLYQPLKALKKTNLALRVDGYTARLKAEAREDIFLAMTGDVSRVRALFEVGYRSQGTNKGVLDAKLNGGARLESGDIGKGVGFELGGEFAYTHQPSGFSIGVDVSTLLRHTAQRYRHFDAGVRILLDPGTKKRGLQFRLEPRIGGATPASQVWDGTLVDGSGSPAGQLGTSGLGKLQTALGLSYGFAARQSLLTPFTEMRLDDRGAPANFKLGMRLSRVNLPIDIALYTQKAFRNGDTGSALGGDNVGTTASVHLKLNWRWGGGGSQALGGSQVLGGFQAPGAFQTLGGSQATAIGTISHIPRRIVTPNN